MKFPHLVAVCATLVTAISLLVEPRTYPVAATGFEVSELMAYDDLR